MLIIKVFDVLPAHLPWILDAALLIIAGLCIVTAQDVGVFDNIHGRDSSVFR